MNWHQNVTCRWSMKKMLRNLWKLIGTMQHNFESLCWSFAGVIGVLISKIKYEKLQQSLNSVPYARCGYVFCSPTNTIKYNYFRWISQSVPDSQWFGKFLHLHRFHWASQMACYRYSPYRNYRIALSRWKFVKKRLDGQNNESQN